MVNYTGIVYEDANDPYGTDQFKKNKSPQFYLHDDGHSPDLNIQDFDDEDVRNGLDEFRNGYFEPEGDLSLTAHTKSAPTVFYGVCGLYKFTENTGTATSDGRKLNTHEFWIGDRMERPSFNADFTSGDFLLKRIFGGIFDSMEWDANLQKTTVDLSMIYKNEAIKKIALESYRNNFNMLKTLPLVGYDYTVQIGDPEDGMNSSSNCFNDFKLTIENNHQTGDDARCLGSITYGFKPIMENCNVEAEAVTKWNRRNYEFIAGAMHNEYNPNEDGWNTYKPCKEFTKPVVVAAQSCIDPDESITFKMPKCRVTLEPIEADSNVLEATLKLKPFNTEQVMMADGTTKKKTSLYIRVITSSPRVGPDILE
ncbi:hypothetical protein PXD04_10395 [Methanosphaera sp. ISO3-F5]|uniref:hypothetical protein n=1 Tax=Methanosphaera sp. ISO3-F5 TaxID=1452353 RepID=UPI002B261F43|nr:hypothetical protein [Methanosphaera sp. ISO3-F5]WQH64100.1 hypothetical protein PXD04_10395 [Methanosphaera sp. ISO3-F5]